MKLDPRIKKSCIFNPFTTDHAIEEVRKYIDTKCYFCDDIIAYEGLENCDVGILAGFNYTDPHPYIPVGCVEGYKFCLPAEFVEEEKYRPCTLDDFGLNIGDLIRFRRKDDHAFEICTMYMGYLKNNGIVKVLLGECYYSFDVLFNEYEWFDKDSNTWEMFGVEV